MKHLSLVKYVPNAVTRNTSRGILHVQKHSPVILFAGGVVGVVATTVTACRSTLRLDEVMKDIRLDQAQARALRESHPERYSEKSYNRDMLYLYIRSATELTKLYAPALALGALSIAALTGSHHILSKRNAGLAAAYATVEKSFREYRDRVSEELGEDKERELRYGLEACEIETEDENGKKTKQTVQVAKNGSDYSRVFDKFSTNWKETPENNQYFIQCQQNYANDLLRARGHVFLNEVFDMLGLSRTKAGAVVGWVDDNPNGDGFVDFGVFDGDTYQGMRFVTGDESSVILNFNVDGNILDLI